MMLRFLFLICSLLPLLAHATPLSYDGFAKLPVLHDGRVKPLDSFARINLRHEKPVELLAGLLFEPNKRLAEPLFEVKSPRLRKIIGLEEKPNSSLYSYNEIAVRLDAIRPTLQQIADKDRNKYTANEKAIWQIYERIGAFAKISRSLSLLEPLSKSVSPALRHKFNLLADVQLDYVKMLGMRSNLTEALKAIIKQKGDDVASYSRQEQEIAKLSFELTKLQIAGSANDIFRVLPLVASDEWASPWEVIERGYGSPQIGALMQSWKKLSAAYKSKNADAWRQTIADISDQTYAMTDVPSWKLKLEYLYNKASILPKTALLYALIFVLIIISYSKPSAFIARIVPKLYAFALFIHAAAIIARIALLGRPPVSTLYESVLFVALIAAAYGYWLGRNKTSQTGFLIGSLLGGSLLAISDVYAGDGDTMGMLVAVLNTNIWLATHVVCVTIGYGCALVAGTMAHLTLLPSQRFSNMVKLLPFVTVVALLFTAIGTILGGVWADQSWGRFWGWDPKENGALLIVLWLIWLLHSRITTLFPSRVFFALLACTNIIVALSWFGVNLLGAGLHSYGFTDSAAIGLLVFCVGEIVTIAALYIYPLFIRKSVQ